MNCDKNGSSRFAMLEETARCAPDLRGALAKLGFELKCMGRMRNGAVRWQTTSKPHIAEDLSAVVFAEQPNGTWVVIDNKERSGKKYMDAIDAMRLLFGYTYPGAIYALAGAQAPCLPKKEAPAPPAPRISNGFVAPQKRDGSRHVRAYLIKKRCIPQELVNRLIDTGHIYESNLTYGEGKILPMAVFPVCDADKKMVGAECVGTYYGRFKHTVANSNSLYGWSFCADIAEITPDTPIYFCESAIDAMSLYALRKLPGVYVSMDGLKDVTLISMTKCLGGRPVICTDNDKGGNRFREKYTVGMGYDTLIPNELYGKDWNDELQKRARQEAAEITDQPELPQEEAQETEPSSF